MFFYKWKLQVTMEIQKQKERLLFSKLNSAVIKMHTIFVKYQSLNVFNIFKVTMYFHLCFRILPSSDNTLWKVI
jgi:hypothetical protein